MAETLSQGRAHSAAVVSLSCMASSDGAKVLAPMPRYSRRLSKVEKAGAKMVFISNSFSFDKSSGKSGTAPPDAIFLQKLLERNQQLWTLGIYCLLCESA